MSEHPADSALLAFAEGESLDLAEHVKACPDCSSQVRAYRGTASVLACASPLSRSSCPPRSSLATRAELAATEATRLERHLDACPLCRSDLADLQALEAAPDLATVLRGELRLLAELGQGVVKLLGSSWPGLPEPALAAVRGEATAQGARVEVPLEEGLLTLSWAAGEAGVDLRAEATAGAPADYRLALGVAPDFVWESRTAVDGVVVLRGIAPGRYRVWVYAPRASAAGVEIDVDVATG